MIRFQPGTTTAKAIDIEELFKGNSTQLEEARRLAQANGGKLTRDTLEKAAGKASGIEKDVLTAMAELAKNGKQRVSNTEPNVRAKASLEAEVEEAVKKFGVALDTKLIGQEPAKHRLKLFWREAIAVESEDPQVMALVGPPGVGKTLAGEALAVAKYGNDKKFLRINCGEYRTKADLSTLKGAPPGYVGSDKAELSVLSHQSLATKFGEDPPIIVFDEIDKMSKEVREELLAILGKFLETGELTDTYGTTKTYARATVIFTSNFGSDSPLAKNLEGDPLRKHYEDAFRNEMPAYIVSRCPNIIAMDPLSKADVAKIVKLELGEPIAKQVEKLEHDKGVSVKIGVSDEAASFIAECGHSTQHGARVMRNIVKAYVGPKIPMGLDNPQDLGRYELQLKANDGESPQAFEIRCRQIAKTFQDALPNIPASFNFRDFPVTITCTNPHLKFYDYEGNHPLAGGEAPQVFGGGTIDGRGFFVGTRAVAVDGVEAEPAKLYVLRPGPSEAQDKFFSFDLPKEIANANIGVYTTAIDEKRVLVTGVGISADGKKIEKGACVFDVDTQQITPVDPMPLDTYGYALGGGEGTAVAFGGRTLKQFGGQWMFSQDPTQVAGEPVENVFVKFDAATLKWQVQEGVTAAAGRMGAASVRVGDEIWFAGGEETVQIRNGKQAQSSQYVDGYNLKTGQVRAVAELPEGMSYSTVVFDNAGRVRTLGAAQYRDHGQSLSLSASVYTLDPEAKTPRWKKMEGQYELPLEAAGVGVVPRGNGFLLGPMPDGTFMTYK